MKKILIPIPSYGFDPTEAAIPWKICSKKGFTISFATPSGEKAAPDIKMLEGQNLGIWKPFLQARKDGREACREMLSSSEYSNPLKYEDIQAEEFDALLLSGGHDKGVKEYLESEILQNVVVHFFKEQKPIAAVCHGVVLAARSIDPETKKSVLFDYKTTALLKTQERLAYNLTRLWLGDYYLTYPETTVEDEVRSVLSNPKNFIQGSLPLARDDAKHLGRGFIVRDRHYLSARWPGDIYNFAFEFLNMLED